MPKEVDIREKVLKENDRVAQEMRVEFSQRRILVLNMVSSPGSGKTSLLERTFLALGDRLRMAVIAGDVQTENDADRLKAAGATMVRPLLTGGACHLDARMVKKALDCFESLDFEVLFIENVGNLVCPAGYDLGEDMKVAVISVTEGDDKPLKYPAMFRRSSVMAINKIDLIEHCNFSLHTVRDNALQINGRLRVLEFSCRTGENLGSWYAWLQEMVARKGQPTGV